MLILEMLFTFSDILSFGLPRPLFPATVPNNRSFVGLDCLAICPRNRNFRSFITSSSLRLRQNPSVGTFVNPTYSKKSAIAPQFESSNPLRISLFQDSAFCSICCQFQVAVKIIDRTKFDEKTRRLLSQEMDNMNRLSNHPNIIQLYQMTKTHQKWCIMMEYAPAGELHSHIKTKGPIEDTRARYIILQIASAVQFMHDHNIVHRDLKAENVLFSSNSIIKIADFGFSKLEASPDQQLTTFCGSPPYAAPELFVSDAYVGPPVDMWAIGVILFYMLVGHLPFRGETRAKIRRQVLDAKINLPDHFPESCVALITGMLNPRVKKRCTITDLIRSVWIVKGGGTSNPTSLEAKPSQLDDGQVRALLYQWWEVCDLELNDALKQGPVNALTGVYRILRSEGSSFRSGGSKLPKAVASIKTPSHRREYRPLTMIGSRHSRNIRPVNGFNRQSSIGCIDSENGRVESIHRQHNNLTSEHRTISKSQPSLARPMNKNCTLL